MAAEFGGEALGEVDSGGVAQGDVFGNVVGGQFEFGSGAHVGHHQGAVGTDAIDGVPVAVAHEIGAANGQVPVVFPGLDDVPGRCCQPVRQRRFTPDVGDTRIGDAVAAGPGVELIDGRVGGGQQQAVASSFDVGAPRVVRHVGGGGIGADMDALRIDVEAQSGGVSGPQGQGGGGLGFGVEPYEF
ncbi:Uncharacterised protein [Mycobacteroides abscessus subsp. abscessus]|nr:Uncharacterised protein [Mycobacteroides abscessus subsp. abscessus]